MGRPEIRLVKSDLVQIVQEARKFNLPEHYTKDLDNEDMFAMRIIAALFEHVAIYGIRPNIDAEWINNE